MSKQQSDNIINLAERQSQVEFAAANRREQLGKQRYRDDCKQRPNYHNGAKRREWDELDDIAQWSWMREL